MRPTRFARLLSLCFSIGAASAQADDHCSLFVYSGEADQCTLTQTDSGIAPVELHYGTLGTDALILKIVGGEPASPRKFEELNRRIEFFLDVRGVEDGERLERIEGEAGNDRITYRFTDSRRSTVYVANSHFQPAAEAAFTFNDAVREVFGRGAIAILIANPR